jgi:hypothetical protein
LWMENPSTSLCFTSDFKLLTPIDGPTIDAISLHYIQLTLVTTCINYITLVAMCVGFTTFVATCVGFVALVTCALTPLHSHTLLHGT